jgi:hypothetical protein
VQQAKTVKNAANAQIFNVWQRIKGLEAKMKKGKNKNDWSSWSERVPG